MKTLFILSNSTLLFLCGFVGSSYSSQEFTFDVTIPKNTCDVSVVGTSANKIDFGSIPLEKFKDDVPQGKYKSEFKVNLSNCKNTSFSGAYVSLSGIYNDQNNGFLDDVGKTFAIRISKKANATQSDTDFFTNTNNKIWTNITATNMSNTYYAYVMCKTGVNNCSDDQNVGKFKSTLTLTFVAD